MDTGTSWRWQDSEGIDSGLQKRQNFKICVDGALRGTNVAEQRPCAIACVFYVVTLEADSTLKHKPVFLAAELLDGIHSAFQAEATALDWAIAHWKTFARE